MASFVICEACNARTTSSVFSAYLFLDHTVTLHSSPHNPLEINVHEVVPQNHNQNLKNERLTDCSGLFRDFLCSFQCLVQEFIDRNDTAHQSYTEQNNFASLRLENIKFTENNLKMKCSKTHQESALLARSYDLPLNTSPLHAIYQLPGLNAEFHQVLQQSKFDEKFDSFMNLKPFRCGFSTLKMGRRRVEIAVSKVVADFQISFWEQIMRHKLRCFIHFWEIF